MFGVVILGVPMLTAVAQNVDRGDEFTNIHPSLVDYDSNQHIHITTAAQAKEVRQSIIKYFWKAGELPTRKMPTKVTAIYSGAGEEFPVQLGKVKPSYVARIDLLEMSTCDLESQAYWILSKASSGSRKLAIVHHGHAANLTHGLDATANLFLRHGFDVLAMNMPLLGWNPDRTVTLPDGTSATIGDHSKLMNAFGAQNDNGFRVFLDPVITGINYFVSKNPDYQDIVMTGLSGGGWTTHVVAAVDTRIRLSVPVAGSIPLYIRKIQPGSTGDLEQTWPGLYEERASWLDIYILGACGEGRKQIQVLNQFDSCCFYGVQFKTYKNTVSEATKKLGNGEWDLALDTTHRKHLMSSFTINRVIAGALNLSDKSKDDSENGVPSCQLSESAPVNFCCDPDRRERRRASGFRWRYCRMR